MNITDRALLAAMRPHNSRRISPVYAAIYAVYAFLLFASIYGICRIVALNRSIDEQAVEISRLRVLRGAPALEVAP